MSGQMEMVRGTRLESTGGSHLCRCADENGKVQELGTRKA
jgi:hypothetical protein